MRNVSIYLHTWCLVLAGGLSLFLPASGIAASPGQGMPETLNPKGENYAIWLPGAATNAGGANSNVTLPPLNISSLPVTIEMWYKPDQDAASTYYATLFYSRGTTAGNPNVGIQYDRWTDTEKIKAVWNGSGQIPEVRPVPGEWNHVALVVTPTSKLFYINGVPFTESGISYTNFPFSWDIYLGWDNIYWTTVDDSRTLKGEIDEVRIWTTERSAQELEAYKYAVLNGDEPGLHGYWNFDDQAEGVATDLSVHGFHGTINGGSYTTSTLFSQMEYLRSDAYQEEGYVDSPSTNNVLMVLSIQTQYPKDALQLTGLDLSLTGTSDLSDISNLRVFATGNDSIFTTENPVAESGGTPVGENLLLECSYTLLPGKNFFWVTVDVSRNAATGNILDMVCNSFDLLGQDTITHIPATPSPEGSLIINPEIFIKHAKLPVSIVTTNGSTYSSDGANFASFQQNAIMTYRGYQYVTYWNKSGKVCLSRRLLPDGSWQELVFSDYTTPHSLSDNHYTISMGICENDGTIHLAYDHHNDDLNYRISVDSLANHPEKIPWSAASFGPTLDYLEKNVKVANVTYPRFISKPNGDLIYECRIGWSGDGDSFLWEYIAESGTWSYIGEYLNGTDLNPAQNAYNNGVHYDPDGRMHVSWVWRETPEPVTNHDVYYGYSDDDGRTWYNAEGVHIGTVETNPMTLNTPGLKVWTVNKYRGLINQESQAVDSKGGIHILQSYMLDGEPNNSNFWSSRIDKGYLRHIYRDDAGTWHSDVIARSTRNRSEIAVDANDNVYVVAPGYRVYYAASAEGWKTWRVLDISEEGKAINEGLIDREALLYEDLLSFVFAHSDNNGKIIVPCYLLENSRPPAGPGLQFVIYSDTGWVHPVHQVLDSVNLKPDDYSWPEGNFSIRYDGILETRYPEPCTLHLTTSFNTILHINDKMLLETGTLDTAGEFQVTLSPVPSHKQRLRIKGVKTNPETVLKMEWSGANQEREIVPLTSLYGALKEFSNDATLSLLTVDAGALNPVFNPDQTAYSDTVPYGTTSLTVTALPNDPNAHVTGDGIIDVSSGKETASITVIAEDGIATLTYTINITVKAPNNDATLRELQVDTGTLDPQFNPEQTDYSILVPEETAQVTITAEANDPNATVEGDGIVDVSSGSAAVVITVTAEDGLTTKVYNIQITVEGVDIHHRSENLMQVYPTLSSGAFTVNVEGPPGTVTVYNLHGQMISRQEMAFSEEKIHISESGMFLIFLKSKDASKMFRVIKAE
ncbi:MAG: BNR-4 repeat-containing protein [Bacteroidales bacterium]|nr:BNR-4 repeat-containing protein [Bacteroidales bacterium]